MKLTKNDLAGMACYFAVAAGLGPSTAVILLALKENADRCHYYGGKWDKGDLARGCIAIAIGAAAHRLIFGQW